MIALWLGACAANDPALVAHRALGVAPDADENQPAHALEALDAGYGVELDLRLDGDGCAGDATRAATDGCFDLGHNTPNGHTLAEVIDALRARDEPPPGPLVLDVVHDPAHATLGALLPYLSQAGPLGLPLVIQTSSAEGLAMLDVLRESWPLADELRLGLTYFANPEFTVPPAADLLVVHIAELPVQALPVPVAAYGVATEHSFALAQTASSDVQWVITDVPGRFDGR